MLVQLPLPDAIDPARIALAIDPAKDVDGLHPINAGRLLANEPAPGAVHAARAASTCSTTTGVPIEGANAVVIGRSEIVGKPVALLLLHRNATVTICHSRTREPARDRRAAPTSSSPRSASRASCRATGSSPARR